MTDDLREAYSTTADEWQLGPARIYDRLADVLLEPVAARVRGATVADVGAGTGAGGRAARRAGAARVLAVDLAAGMLLADPDRPPALVADVRRIPVRSGGVDVALAAFSLNHVTDPAAGLAELARIVGTGGAVVAGAYAVDDDHPVKGVVEEILARHGWELPEWTARIKADAIPLLATVDGARAAARSAGLPGAVVEARRVPFPDLDAGDLVRWRLGMAQHAPFLATLPPSERAEVAAVAGSLLGSDPPPLVRSVIVLTAVA